MAQTARQPTKKPAKRKVAKAYELPPPLPQDIVVTDLCKKSWHIREAIGQGGFGLIYLASDKKNTPSDSCNYVVKFEPKSNGPLFCEMHFYMNAAKCDDISIYEAQHKMKYLPVPAYTASGTHSYNDVLYRFLVMPRYGRDLHKLFENYGQKFSLQTVCKLGLRLVDALEYIHLKGYTHNDIKAANILTEHCVTRRKVNKIYLVDYGLARKFQVGGKHVTYKEDPRKAHDGTIEFTSRDAHRGVDPSRRGDFEILGYCMLQWISGRLPWENKLENKNFVRNEKERYMKDIPSLLSDCFNGKSHPEFLESYLLYISELDYDEEPQYDNLRTCLKYGLGKTSEWSLDLDLDKKLKRSSTPNKPKVQPKIGNKGDSPSPPKQPKFNKNSNSKVTSRSKNLSPISAMKRESAVKSKAKAIKRLSVVPNNRKNGVKTTKVAGVSKKEMVPSHKLNSGSPKRPPLATVPHPRTKESTQCVGVSKGSKSSVKTHSNQSLCSSSRVSNQKSPRLLTPIEIARKRKTTKNLSDASVQTSPSLRKKR